MTTRIFLARHGQATYENDLISDDGGWLTPLGRQQSRDLGRGLRAESIAAVWCSSLSRAVQTAELAAAELGVDEVTVREGLREYSVGSLAGAEGGEGDELMPIYQRWAAGDDTAAVPGGHTINEWVAQVIGVLHEVAATYADQTVLVVGHGGAMLASVPVLCGLPRVSEPGHGIANCAYLVLAHDGEEQATGWTLLPEEMGHLG